MFSCSTEQIKEWFGLERAFQVTESMHGDALGRRWELCIPSPSLPQHCRGRAALCCSSREWNVLSMVDAEVSQMSQSTFYSQERLWWVRTVQTRVNRVVSVAYLDPEQLCCSFLRGCQVKLKALSIWPFAGITPTMAYSAVSTVAVVITMDFTLRMQIEFLIVGFNPGWAVITEEFCSCWSILGSCKSQKYCSKVRNAIFEGRKKRKKVMFRETGREGKGSRLCQTGQVWICRSRFSWEFLRAPTENIWAPWHPQAVATGAKRELVTHFLCLANTGLGQASWAPLQ